MRKWTESNPQASCPTWQFSRLLQYHYATLPNVFLFCGSGGSQTLPHRLFTDLAVFKTVYHILLGTSLFCTGCRLRSDDCSFGDYHVTDYTKPVFSTDCQNWTDSSHGIWSSAGYHSLICIFLWGVGRVTIPLPQAPQTCALPIELPTP